MMRKYVQDEYIYAFQTNFFKVFFDNNNSTVETGYNDM